MKNIIRSLLCLGLVCIASVRAGTVISGFNAAGSVQDAKIDNNGNVLTSNAPSAIPTNTISVTGVAATTSTNLIVLESGPVKKLIITRAIIDPGTATADGNATITINRNTVAATAAGTLASGAAMQHDPGDAVFSGIVRSGAFTVSGVTVTATSIVITVVVPISTTATPIAPLIVDFTNNGQQKGLVVPVGVTNGIMFTYSGLAGQANLGLSVDFTEQ
jgi:hypothetical protein